MGAPHSLLILSNKNMRLGSYPAIFAGTVVVTIRGTYCSPPASDINEVNLVHLHKVPVALCIVRHIQQIVCCETILKQK